LSIKNEGVEKIDEIEEEEDQLLLPVEQLLSAGVHIGTRIRTGDMDPFIYRVRPDGLYVLDIRKMDERIRIAAKLIARFDPPNVIVVASRLYGRTPVQKFCEITGCTPVLGRFLPGLFSNPTYSSHLEPRLVLVTDPKASRQAVREASATGVPVLALSDTDNDFSNIDYIIPSNNRGRRALATIYWLLARQVLREKGELTLDGELTTTIDDFETKLTESMTFETE
jgi:small subunit ribosomal protein S2